MARQWVVLHWRCIYCQVGGCCEHAETVHPLGMVDGYHRLFVMGVDHMNRSPACYSQNYSSGVFQVQPAPLEDAP